ncbi:MAG: thioredoxin [Clostridia bacterium]|nr:thioredoxin [Clostridia bacterium]
MTVLNKENFEDEVLNSNKLTVVDFFATWCGPCQMLAPVLEKLSKEQNDLNIFKIDIDESVELAIKYQVEVVPTLVIFKNGNPVKTLEGFRTEKELLEELNKLK